MGTVGNILVQPMEVTWAGSALGFTDGDIEFTVEEQIVDITAHQEGTNVISGIRTGKSASMELVLKETNVDLIEYIFKQGGALETASGATGDVVAWGNSKDFTSVLTQAGKLVLHPVVNSSSNYSQDLAAWKAYPVPSSITFSGENPSVCNIAFKIFPDMTKANEFRLFVYGDHVNGDFSEVD